MQKIYKLEESDLLKAWNLFENKRDNQYIVIGENNGYCDIVQWSNKYQNVHIVTVHKDRLDPSKELY